MKRFFVCGIIILFLGTIAACSIAKEQEVTSTEGLVLEEGVSKNVKTTKQEKSEQRKELKNKRKYEKNITLLKKYKEKKRIKERDLDFIQQRIEIKKQRLEELTSPNSKKGEN